MQFLFHKLSFTQHLFCTTFYINGHTKKLPVYPHRQPLNLLHYFIYYIAASTKA